MKMNKVVIIIEDRFKEFERIKSIIDSSFVCKQNYNKVQFYSFRDNLKNSLIANHANPIPQEKMRNDLFNELRGYCDENEEPVYLIDYLFDGKKPKNKNGINFHEKILKELYPGKIVPVMFFTNAVHSTWLIINDYCEKINDKTICDVIAKPDKDKWDTDTIFSRKVKHFIEQAQSKARPEQKDEPKKLEDLFEYE